MIVEMGVSDHAAWNVILTLVGFTITYLALFFVWFWLTKRAVLSGPTEDDHPTDGQENSCCDVGGGPDSGNADEVGTVSFSHLAAKNTKE